MEKIRLSNDLKWFIVLSLTSSIFRIMTGAYVGIKGIYAMVVIQMVTVYTLSLMSYMVLQKTKVDNIYRDITICLVAVGILRQVSLHEKFIGDIEIGVQLVIAIGIYESVFILMALKNNMNKKRIAQVITNNVIAIILVLIGVYVIHDKLALLGDDGNTTVLYAELQGVIFILCAIAVINVSEIKDRFSEDEYKGFYLFIMARTILQGMVVINSFINNTWTLGAVIVTGLIYNYSVFKVFIINLFRKQAEKLISVKSDTQRSKEADELQELDKEYKELLRVLPEGVAIVQNNIITFANDKLAQLFKTADPFTLETKNIYNLIHRSDHKKFTQLVDNCNNKFITLVHFNHMGHDFAGETKIIYKDNEKKENGYVVIIKDITERLEMQRMENILLEKTEAEKIKSQVLANISHEFKTPVNVIYAATQLQGQNILDKNWEGVGKYNPVISQNCNRLIRLINNFIDLTRFDYGEFPINKVCVNIVTVVEEITLSIVSFAENKGISVLFDTEEEEIFCRVDIDMLDRIVLNLLSNAIKYNKAGGSIKVEMTLHDQYVEIKIEDTGIGIEAEKLHMLFNRFERVDKSLVRDNEGSGLGLNIVKNMVSSLGGDIKVESKFGEGTTMKVYLPIHEMKEGALCEEAAHLYDSGRLRKSVEMELSDIYE